MAEVKRWRVRYGKFGFLMPDGLSLVSTRDKPAEFEATDEEVKGQEYKLDLLDTGEGATPPAREQRPQRRVKIDRMVKAAPQDVMVK